MGKQTSSIQGRRSGTIFQNVLKGAFRTLLNAGKKPATKRGSAGWRNEGKVTMEIGFLPKNGGPNVIRRLTGGQERPGEQPSKGGKGTLLEQPGPPSLKSLRAKEGNKERTPSSCLRENQENINGEKRPRLNYSYGEKEGPNAVHLDRSLGIRSLGGKGNGEPKRSATKKP